MKHNIVNRKDGTYRILENRAAQRTVKISSKPFSLNSNGGFIHPTATVSPEADIAKTAIVGAGCTIAAGVRLGAYCVVGDNTTVSERSEIDSNTTLGMNNIIMAKKPVGHDVIIGQNNCLYDVAAGTGADYFLAPDCVIGNFNRLFFVNSIDTAVQLGDYNKAVGGLFIGACSKIGHRNFFDYSVFFENTISVSNDGEFGAYSKIFRDCVLADEVRLKFEAVISSKCRLASGVEVGRHTILGHSVSLGPGARIGQHCRLGLGSILGTQVSLSDFVKIPDYYKISAHKSLTESINVAREI